MYSQLIITAPIYGQNIPMIDSEFDHFELDNDMEANLREAETPDLYTDDE